MGVSKRLIKKHIIPRRRMASHAAAHLHLGVATKTPGMVNWRGANLGRSITVYDLNNQPLFYDFPVLSRKRRQLGLIRTSASRVLGVPAPSIYLGKTPWDAKEASMKATEIVSKKFKGEVVSTKLVCYAYPKLGIAVEWKKKGQTHRTIVDIGDFSIVPEKVEPGMRGSGAWSFYDHMKENIVPESVRSFGLYEKVVDELQERSGKNLGISLALYEFDSVQAVVAEVFRQLYTTKILSFCDHSFSHECFRMHAQENGWFCVVATGQMILDFWRYYCTQNDVSTAMGTTTGGTGYSGEVNGLDSLTCSDFDAQHDSSPTFAKAKAEIDANRPFDYSYSYHAMACAGYRRLRFWIVGMQSQHSLLLYDPWPVNMGTRRWETWGAGLAPVDGYVYLRRP